MPLHPIVERILDEGVCMAEILEHNAMILVAWLKDVDRHHTPSTCTSTSKHCVHAPGQGEIDLAVDHVRRMPEVCTCGRHR
jgi:hypothetical protein